MCADVFRCLCLGKVAVMMMSATVYLQTAAGFIWHVILKAPLVSLRQKFCMKNIRVGDELP